ncbi:MAG: tetratricopeptide repeat protein [Deltaproteobacteria bacterium]|jgi:tetratricopeptide (TPR) repeat protein|nr:tetratricopeptide repeat protein [Deltaproteobacteria bacterium]
MMSDSSRLVNKAAIALLTLGLAAMFIASFSYRLGNPSLHKSVSEKQANQPNFGGRGMDSGMTRDSMERIAGLMAKLREKPDDFDTRMQLAEAFREVGDATGSAAHLQKALAIRPDSAEGHYNLGIMLYELGEYEESARSFERVLELEEDLSAMFNLAIVYHQQLEKTEEARGLFSRIAAAAGAPPDLRERARAILESLE